MNNIRNKDHRQPPAHDEHAREAHAIDEHAFDQAMQRRYAESLSRLPSGTHARLRDARHAAVIQTPARIGNGAGFGWKLTSAFAAVFALALGLQFFSAPAPDPSTPDATRVAVADTATDAERTVVILDENPDLYLWLAVNDDALRPLPEQ